MSAVPSSGDTEQRRGYAEKCDQCWRPAVAVVTVGCDGAAHPTVTAEAVLEVVTPLIRASVVAECAQAIEAAAGRYRDAIGFDLTYEDRSVHAGLFAALEAVRALVSPLEGDKT